MNFSLESMIQDLLSHRYRMEPMNIAFVSREFCQKNRLQFFVSKQDPGLACIPVPSHKDELLLALSRFLSGVAQLSFLRLFFCLSKRKDRNREDEIQQI